MIRSRSKEAFEIIFYRLEKSVFDFFRFLEVLELRYPEKRARWTWIKLEPFRSSAATKF